MPGACFDERSIRKALAPEDRRAVAIALAETLADAQRLTSPFAGDFGMTSIALEPYPVGATQHVVDETREFADLAARNGTMTDDDHAWLDAAAARALSVPERPNTFVHCDYKLNNLTVMQSGDGWRVSGLFDLHEARFGDGARDLARQTCSYLDTDPELASVFVDSYLQHVAADRAHRGAAAALRDERSNPLLAVLHARRRTSGVDGRQDLSRVGRTVC